MELSCMAYAIARNQTGLNHETAYLCGLMHDVGKLYILTKAEDFPELLGDADSLQAVMEEWNPQISKSIVELWGFPEEVVESTDPQTYAQQDADDDATFLDVMIAAKIMVDGDEEQVLTMLTENESSRRLGIDASAVEKIRSRYEEKFETVRQSLS
jgi:HD-like signal output (HDOD) protein